MSECVVRMEMPENCCECQLRQEGYEMGEEFCPFTGVECLSIGRQNNCPIICQLPDEHGRLIDAKRIEYELCEGILPKKYCDFNRRVLNSENLTPTIVPAEAERSET